MSFRTTDNNPPAPISNERQNEMLRAAASKRNAKPSPRAKAPTPEERLAALNANMRPAAPPEDATPAMRAMSRRLFDAEHAVPPPVSNEEQNRRLTERAQ